MEKKSTLISRLQRYFETWLTEKVPCGIEAIYNEDTEEFAVKLYALNGHNETFYLNISRFSADAQFNLENYDWKEQIRRYMNGRENDAQYYEKVFDDTCQIQYTLAEMDADFKNKWLFPDCPAVC